MMKPESDKYSLPGSYTQTVSNVTIIGIDHVELTGDNHASILRAGNAMEIGSLLPFEIVLRPLGGPFFYRGETYEITPYACIVFCKDGAGNQINLTAGSSLVDALIILSPTQKIPFMGKVTERIPLTHVLTEASKVDPELDGGAALDELTGTDSQVRFSRTLSEDNVFGYIIRFSQITLKHQDELRRHLAQKTLGQVDSHQGKVVPS